MSNDFEPVKKGPAGVLPAGMVRIDDHGRLHFPKRTFEMIGEPTAVLAYTNGKQAAFKPTDKGDRDKDNCYIVTQREKDGHVRFERIVNALDIPEGRHTIEQNDDELWVLEVNDE